MAARRVIQAGALGVALLAVLALEHAAPALASDGDVEAEAEAEAASADEADNFGMPDLSDEEIENLVAAGGADAAGGPFGGAGMGGMGDMGGMGEMGGMGDMGGMGGGEDMFNGMSPEDMEAMMAQMNGGGGMGGMGDMGGMGGMGGMGDMFGGMGGGMGGMGGPPVEGVKSDVKFIVCDTCKALVAQGISLVSELKASLPNTKISEHRMDDLLEPICNAKEAAGEWVAKQDMVEAEDGSRIALVAQEKPGQCLEECKTVEMACEKIYDKAGTDLVEQIYIGKKSAAEMEAFVCEQLIRPFKGACGKPYPSIPAGREVGGDNFVPKSEEELEMDDINRKMRASQNGMMHSEL